MPEGNAGLQPYPRNQIEGRFKLDILVSEGTHTIEGDVNKQINDKERVAAAMENPNLLGVRCLK